MSQRFSPSRPHAVLAGAAAVALLLAGLTASPAAANTGTTSVVVQVDSVTDPTAAAAQAAADLGGTVEAVYDSGTLNGYSVSVPTAALDQVAAQPGVTSVSPDLTYSTAATQAPVPVWGLDRIDQRQLPLSGAYTYASTGTGVTAYVIDSGIRVDHTDFGSRARWGGDFYTLQPSNTDCLGHGTHVAGIIGGSQYGVAKNVNLVAVRVLGCRGTGTLSTILAGIQFVLDDHTAHPGPAVANLSLTGGSSVALDTAIQAMTDAGIIVVVAAGNSNNDACQYSPAEAPTAITVGATDINDARAVYSNKGSCVDMFAPGTDITSDWNASTTATLTESGTSMASPHVAGAAARYLSTHPTATPAQVTAALAGNATVGVVSDAQSVNNKLLYMMPGVALSTFTAPVDAAPVTNTAQAGRTIPFKFSATDEDGRPITNLTSSDVSIYSKLSSAACSTAAGDAIETYADGTATLLNLGGGNYQYSLQTKKSWSGLCGPLGVNVRGVVQSAQFGFR